MAQLTQLPPSRVTWEQLESDRTRLRGAAIYPLLRRILHLAWETRYIGPGPDARLFPDADPTTPLLHLPDTEQANRLEDLNLRSIITTAPPSVLAAWDAYGIPAHYKAPPPYIAFPFRFEIGLFLLASAYSDPLFVHVLSLLDHNDRLSLRATNRILRLAVDQFLARHVVVDTKGVRSPTGHELPRGVVDDAYAAGETKILSLPLPRGSHVAPLHYLLWDTFRPPPAPPISPYIRPHIVRTAYTFEHTFIPGNPEQVMAFTDLAPEVSEQWLVRPDCIHVPTLPAGVAHMTWNIIFGCPAQLTTVIAQARSWSPPPSLRSIVIRLVRAKEKTLPPKPRNAVTCLPPDHEAILRSGKSFQVKITPIPQRALTAHEFIEPVPREAWNTLPSRDELLIDSIALFVVGQFYRNIDITVVGADKWRHEWLNLSPIPHGKGSVQDRFKASLRGLLGSFLPEFEGKDAEIIGQVESVRFLTDTRFRKMLGWEAFKLHTYM